MIILGPSANNLSRTWPVRVYDDMAPAIPRPRCGLERINKDKQNGCGISISIVLTQTDLRIVIICSELGR